MFVVGNLPTRHCFKNIKSDNPNLQTCGQTKSTSKVIMGQSERPDAKETMESWMMDKSESITSVNHLILALPIFSYATKYFKHQTWVDLNRVSWVKIRPAKGVTKVQRDAIWTLHMCEYDLRQTRDKHELWINCSFLFLLYFSSLSRTLDNKYGFVYNSISYILTKFKMG